jgi:hypothetical protein
MKMLAWVFVGFCVFGPCGLRSQSVQFDFENARVHTSLPISLSAGGISAHFSATGQGFSIQPANTLGFTPAGFSGNCIYPNSVYAADLLISFSAPVNAFSILYAPQELGCDSSATMRVTAFMDGTIVGTGSTNSSFPGTWPSEILAFRSVQSFNRVAIHYDNRPVCQDYGPIFMTDNVVLTPAPQPVVLTNAAIVAGGGLQFSWTAQPGNAFAVLSTTNVAQPLSDWNTATEVIEISPGQFQFTDPQPADACARFYRVRCP